MALLYKGRGGGWYSWWWQGTWPFASLEIYDDKLRFSLWPFNIDVPFNEIK
jgi:hypothetical protein